MNGMGLKYLCDSHMFTGWLVGSSVLSLLMLRIVQNKGRESWLCAIMSKNILCHMEMFGLFVMMQAMGWKVTKVRASLCEGILAINEIRTSKCWLDVWKIEYMHEKVMGLCLEEPRVCLFTVYNFFCHWINNWRKKRVYFGLWFQRRKMNYRGRHGSKCQEQEVESAHSQEQVESR